MAVLTRIDGTPCRICSSNAVVDGVCATCGDGAMYAPARRRPPAVRTFAIAKPRAPRNHVHRWDAGRPKSIGGAARGLLQHCQARACREYRLVAVEDDA